MSEIGDDFKAMREESRLHRTAKQEWSKELLLEHCEKHKIKFLEIQPWHFRLTKGLIIIDIYPQRQKAFMHAGQRWTGYKDLIYFVNQTLKIYET